MILRFFLVSKVVAIVLDCDGVASGRVCYQQGHPFSLPMSVKLFLVLRWDQSATLNSLKTVFHFLFIDKSNQNTNSWNVMYTQLQNYNIKTLRYFILNKKNSHWVTREAPTRKSSSTLNFCWRGGGVKFESKSFEELFEGFFRLEFGHFQGNGGG